jgi:hypothetical protein
MQVYSSPKTILKNKKSTKFFQNAANHYDFKKQRFFWEIKIKPGETQQIKCSYQYQQSAFGKKP